MGIFDNLFKTILKRIINDKSYKSQFLQYHHLSSCKVPCDDCPERDNRIYENGFHIRLPAHPNCDCIYTEVKTLAVGTISKKGLESPDVYLKLYGHLPDYYITKEEAVKVYGWKRGKNTIAGKAPGKMIGGIPYYNNKSKLPVKAGRLWYECDVDYESGGRSSLRLFYSNDGLMFFSPDHGEKIFYLVK